jgi:hypothetical protein
MAEELQQAAEDADVSTRDLADKIRNARTQGVNVTNALHVLKRRLEEHVGKVLAAEVRDSKVLAEAMHAAEGLQAFGMVADVTVATAKLEQWHKAERCEDELRRAMANVNSCADEHTLETLQDKIEVARTVPCVDVGKLEAAVTGLEKGRCVARIRSSFRQCRLAHEHGLHDAPAPRLGRHRAACTRWYARIPGHIPR